MYRKNKSPAILFFDNTFMLLLSLVHAQKLPKLTLTIHPVKTNFQMGPCLEGRRVLDQLTKLLRFSVLAVVIGKSLS